MTTRRLRIGSSTQVYVEPRDAWTGVYDDSSGTLYVCPVPFVVFRSTSRYAVYATSLLSIWVVIALAAWSALAGRELWSATGPAALIVGLLAIRMMLLSVAVQVLRVRALRGGGNG